MNATQHAALLTCLESVRNLAAVLAVLLDTLGREKFSPPDSDRLHYAEEDLSWLDDVLPSLPIEAVDPGGEVFSCEETLSNAGENAENPGTNAAISTCTVRTDLDPVPAVPAVQAGPAVQAVPVLDRPVHHQNEEVSSPVDANETFDLTDAPPARAPAFNARLFDLFWAAYPRKVGRKAAIAAFTRIGPTRAAVAAMVGAIEAQRHARDWTEGFIPHPATWLNAERWTDEIEPVPRAPRREALQRAVGPVRGTWRDRCTHDPECETPTRCEIRTLRAAGELES